jgi:hypothetical protein
MPHNRLVLFTFIIYDILDFQLLSVFVRLDLLCLMVIWVHYAKFVIEFTALVYCGLVW